METVPSSEGNPELHERMMLELLEKAQRERDELKEKLKVERSQNTRFALDIEGLKKDFEKLERVAKAAKAIQGWVGTVPPDTITLGAVRAMIKELDEALSAITWGI